MLHEYTSGTWILEYLLYIYTHTSIFVDMMNWIFYCNIGLIFVFKFVSKYMPYPHKCMIKISVKKCFFLQKKNWYSIVDIQI